MESEVQAASNRPALELLRKHTLEREGKFYANFEGETYRLDTGADFSVQPDGVETGNTIVVELADGTMKALPEIDHKGLVGLRGPGKPITVEDLALCKKLAYLEEVDIEAQIAEQVKITDLPEKLKLELFSKKVTMPDLKMT